MVYYTPLGASISVFGSEQSEGSTGESTVTSTDSNTKPSEVVYG